MINLANLKKMINLLNTIANFNGLSKANNAELKIMVVLLYNFIAFFWSIEKKERN